MPGTEYNRPAYGVADLDPSQDSDRTILEALRQRRIQLDQAREGVQGGGEILTMRYVRPVGLRRHQVESTSDPSQTITLPATVKEAAFVPSQRVTVARSRAGATIIGHPPPGELAVSESPRQSRSGVASPVVIEAMDPVELPAGETTNVTLTGYGFASSPVDVFSPVAFNETTLEDETDSLITAGTASYVSATEVTLDVTVDSAAPIGHSISFSVDRG